ncbi:MAG TPA: PP2C family protein-serine/threonine phosphatase [Anaerolineae bacterium]|nr:PP2C family protein-serine/threonine phosphatase [Anaerolineae bacterium]
MPELEVQVAAAKIAKYATDESGDTLEVIERPRGGFSLVLADGQRSGRAAKAISNIVARKAVALLAEGVRDGAVARAAHDYLSAIRGGKVSATLNILSLDLVTETIVISRNSHCPTIVARSDGFLVLDEPSQPVGIHTWTKPLIAELPLLPDTYVVLYTDGLMHAGRRHGEGLDVLGLVQTLIGREKGTASTIADALLARAVACDQGRPDDDISVVVVSVSLAPPDGDAVRRLRVDFPVRVRRAI